MAATATDNQLKLVAMPGQKPSNNRQYKPCQDTALNSGDGGGHGGGGGLM